MRLRRIVRSRLIVVKYEGYRRITEAGNCNIVLGWAIMWLTAADDEIALDDPIRCAYDELADNQAAHRGRYNALKASPNARHLKEVWLD